MVKSAGCRTYLSKLPNPTWRDRGMRMLEFGSAAIQKLGGSFSPRCIAHVSQLKIKTRYCESNSIYLRIFKSKRRGFSPVPKPKQNSVSYNSIIECPQDSSIGRIVLWLRYISPLRQTKPLMVNSS